MQDIVAGSKGSSTLFHIDAPLPMPSTIFVIDGIKEVGVLLMKSETVCSVPRHSNFSAAHNALNITFCAFKEI